eukprot:scaffold139228_cov59-Cyclotella_meneghiniana.AAC.1
MNPSSGLVSPQFHVVFDDTFSTIPHLRSGTIPSNWEHLVRNSKELVTHEDYDLTRTWFDGLPTEPSGVPEATEPASRPLGTSDNNTSRGQSDNHAGNPMDFPEDSSDLPIDITDVNSPPDVPLVDTRTSCVNEGGISPSPADSSPVSEGDDELRMPKMVNLRESGLRRSSRISAKKTKSTLLTVLLAATALISSPSSSIEYAKSGFNSLNNAVNMAELNFDGSVNSFKHHVFASGKENCNAS